MKYSYMQTFLQWLLLFYNGQRCCKGASCVCCFNIVYVMWVYSKWQNFNNTLDGKCAIYWVYYFCILGLPFFPLECVFVSHVPAGLISLENFPCICLWFELQSNYRSDDTMQIPVDPLNLSLSHSKTSSVIKYHSDTSVLLKFADVMGWWVFLPGDTTFGFSSLF